jgi:hypothetical protein
MNYAVNCPVPFNNTDCVLLGHGSGGGRLSHQLIRNVQIVAGNTQVRLKTLYGNHRIISMLNGDPLPRIC